MIEFQIEDLDISVRALNSIKQAGIKTTDELFSLDTRQMTLLNFSKRTIIEILSYERENKRINKAPNNCKI